MGFFSNQRIKNGTKATQREDRVSMPKDKLNTNVKPQVMEGSQGITAPINQASVPFDMDKSQQRDSKRSPR